MLFSRNQLEAVRRVAAGQRWLIGMATLIVATWYAASALERGWIPHDEGQLGHTAERVLHGELPHRDFVEPYTGGLSYLHAAAFRLFGVGSRALRWTLLPFFAAFVVCTYGIANRAAPPWLAACVTFLCTCLTLPVYPAGMPSWYNLFAAVCGTAALLRYLDSGRRRWVVLAGVLAGLSILVKITGLYFVAAGLLFLVYREQQEYGAAVRSADAVHGSSRRGVVFSLLISLFLCAFGSLGVLFLRSENPLMDIIHFGLPFAGLAWVMLQSEWRHGRSEIRPRIVRLAGSCVPFLLGIAVPVIVLLAVYWQADALGDLYQGVLVLPRRRLAGAQLSLPHVRWLLMAAPWSGLLAAGFWMRRPPSRRVLLAVVLGLVALFALSHTDRGHLAIFQGLRNQLPILLAMSLAVLGGHLGSGLSRVGRQELLLLTAVALLISLVQFPYSGGFYFFYAAPPTVLLGLFLVRSQPQSPRTAHFACLLFVVAFLVLRVHQPGPAIAGGPYRPETPTARLALDRSELTVRADQARLFHELVTTIQAYSPDNSYIYAAPDCPEVYFFSARRNPTKTTYELFDRQPQATSSLLATLDACDVRVVVLKQRSEFTSTMDAELIAALRRRFPASQELWSQSRDLGYLVLWRSSRDLDHGHNDRTVSYGATVPSDSEPVPKRSRCVS